MESTDSLVSQTSLPPKMSDNLDYRPPPALPPKRHRTNVKLNNLNITPPSSPKLILSESIEPAMQNDLSSQSINNNVLNNNRNKLDNNIMKPNVLPSYPPPAAPSAAISPSSNYVQISTSTINAAAAAADVAKQQQQKPDQLPISPTKLKSNIEPVSNNIPSDANNVVNNDVRVIYTNVNHLSTTNNRSSTDDTQYIQLYDGNNDDQNKKSIQKIDSDTNTENTTKDNQRCPVQQNNSSQFINNNNNSINDKNADDEEDIVVLRRPQASSNSSLKVCRFHFLIFLLFSVAFFYWIFGT